MRTRDKARLERAVQRGVAYLDANPDKEEAFEDWYRRINPNYLSMANGSYCIIGQLMGDYTNLANVDDFHAKGTDWLSRWATRHGFLVNDRHRPGSYNPEFVTHGLDYEWRDEAYAYLGHLWSTEVESRQLAKELSDSLTALSQG